MTSKQLESKHNHLCDISNNISNYIIIYITHQNYVGYFNNSLSASVGNSTNMLSLVFLLGFIHYTLGRSYPRPHKAGPPDRPSSKFYFLSTAHLRSTRKVMFIPGKCLSVHTGRGGGSHLHPIILPWMGYPLSSSRPMGAGRSTPDLNRVPSARTRWGTPSIGTGYVWTGYAVGSTPLVVCGLSCFQICFYSLLG